MENQQYKLLRVERSILTIFTNYELAIFLKHKNRIVGTRNKKKFILKENFQSKKEISKEDENNID